MLRLNGILNRDLQFRARHTELKLSLHLQYDHAGQRLFLRNFQASPPAKIKAASCTSTQIRTLEIENSQNQTLANPASIHPAPARSVAAALSSSQGNSRIDRVHPVSASRIEFPHPDGKNGASFCLTSLSAW